MVDWVASKTSLWLWYWPGGNSSLVLVSLREGRAKSKSGLLAGSVAPLLDNGLGNAPRVLPGSDTDLLGHVKTVLEGLQLGNELGHMLALALGLQVTDLLGHLRDEL